MKVLLQYPVHLSNLLNWPLELVLRVEIRALYVYIEESKKNTTLFH
jgi:hypothetical protein